MPYGSVTASNTAQPRAIDNSSPNTSQIPLDARLPYFDRILSDAVPLPPATEQEIARQIEDLSLQRAAIVLGIPAIIGELQKVAARRLAEGSDGAETLRLGDTESFLAQSSAAAFEAIERGRRGISDSNTVAAELSSVGRSIAQHTGLKALSAASAASIDRYVGRLDGAPFSARRREHRGALLGDGGLTPEVAVLLAERLDGIDTALKPLLDRFVTANLRLVRAVARRMYADPELRDELIAEGQAALCRCAREFKASLGLRFSSYAFKSIRHAMLNALAKHSETRVVRTKTTDGSENAVFCVSLNRPAPTNPEQQAIEFVSDKTSPNPFDLAAESDERSLSSMIVRKAIQELSPEDRGIISSLFGLDKAAPMTPTELAQQLGLSRETMRGVISRIYRRLGSDISTNDSAHLQALGFQDPAEDRTDTRGIYRVQAPSPHPSKQAPSAIEPPRRSPSMSPPRSAQLPASAQLFDAVDEYSSELTRIRRLSNTPSAEEELRSRCLAELENFHRAVSIRWPAGHSEKRYGFALEGELLTLKRVLSTEQVTGIRRAIRWLDRRLQEL